jgi:transcriptional regulator with XRE-family HTH domain
MARNFSELRANMLPEARAKADSLAKKYLAELPLDELRVARNMSQESLAKILGVKQNAVSKLERRTDMYVSSLRGVIRAMGGDLRIEAVFPDGVVLIDQFNKVGKHVSAAQVDITSKLPQTKTKRGLRANKSIQLHREAKKSRSLTPSAAPKSARRIQSSALATS